MSEQDIIEKARNELNTFQRVAAQTSSDLIIALVKCRAALAAEKEAREKAEADYREEEKIVSRIWKILGSPSYEELGGKSVYDLVSSAEDLSAKLEAAKESLAEVAGDIHLPETNSVQNARTTLATLEGDT